MRTLSIIAYAIGSILLIASCFTTGFTVTWCEGGAAVAFLVIGLFYLLDGTFSDLISQAPNSG